MTLFCFLLQEQKEGPGGEAYSLCLCKRHRDAFRRDKTTTIVLGGNPSVSLAADSSPCTGEPLVQCYTPLHRGALGQV